jgi:hypothetical protein
MRLSNHPVAVQLACLCLLGFLLLAPKQRTWYCMADCFHQLIEPYPPYDSMCGDTETEGSAFDRAAYRLDVRIVTVPYGRGASAVPPLSGYVTSRWQFFEGVQGDVRCSIFTLPESVVREGTPAGWRFGPLALQVSKVGRHFQLDYTQGSGVTYAQEFELPVGVTFATNLREIPVQNFCQSPGLPSCLSMLDRWLTWWEPVQMECFVLVSYSEIEGDEKVGRPHGRGPSVPQAIVGAHEFFGCTSLVFLLR